MLIYKTGDLTDELVFCHQVNCKGVMGAGLAKQIRAKYPSVYEEYMDLYRKNRAILGMTHMTYLPEGKVCVSMFAQDGYGRDKQYTDYKAFRACLRGLSELLKGWKVFTRDGWPDGEPYDSIAFPYGIGCGLAGGDWNIISKYLEEFSEEVKQKVYIVRRQNEKSLS